MRYSLIRWTATVLATGALLAACAGSSDDFKPGASIPGDGTRSPAATSSTPATSTTTAPTTTATEVPATAASTTADTAVSAPSTDPEVVATPQAPGFDIPAADLETDPTSPNNNRLIRPEDEPVIAAYLAAGEAQLTAFSTLPLDADSPELLAAPFTSEALDGLATGFAYRSEQNQVLDISQGVTARPYVIEDDDGDPDRAIVWDCQIDATFWKDVGTGEKAPPEESYPNVGAPGVELGTAALMVRVGGEWLAASGSLEPRACA